MDINVNIFFFNSLKNAWDRIYFKLHINNYFPKKKEKKSISLKFIKAVPI